MTLLDTAIFSFCILFGFAMRRVLKRHRAATGELSALRLGNEIIAQARRVKCSQRFVGDGFQISRTIKFELRGVGRFEAEVLEARDGATEGEIERTRAASGDRRSGRPHPPTA